MLWLVPLHTSLLTSKPTWTLVVLPLGLGRGGGGGNENEGARDEPGGGDSSRRRFRFDFIYKAIRMTEVCAFGKAARDEGSERAERLYIYSKY